jgi:alginate O-acetyltransferase complex protein AlgI
MLFNSTVFAAFFAVFVAAFLCVRKHIFARNLLILIASYFFYGWWDARFLILIAASTSVDYLAAMGASGQIVRRVDYGKAAAYLCTTTLVCIAAASSADLWILPAIAGFMVVFACAAWFVCRSEVSLQRRRWLTLSLVCNLGILAFFKYFNFFVGSAIDSLATLGVSFNFTTLHIILPVGLSFYTFQGLSRTIDAYQGKLAPKPSIINYGAYLSFFPQLVAGPIERASHLLPQFDVVRPVTRQMVGSGALLFLWGLYLKVVVADNVAPIADSVFASPTGLDSGTTLAGVLAFTVQIYCDFCGYSNMARGMARCLGFDLMVNFNLPYFSRTPSEFWQRWHISLSSWLRDYLYIPLGGNRAGEGRTYRNLMTTMLLGGLWHGAAWTFVAWGAFHGGILILYRALGIDAFLQRHTAGLYAALVNIAAWAAMLSLVMFGWILFRARSFADVVTVTGNIFSGGGYELSTFLTLLTYAGPLVLVEVYQRIVSSVEPLWLRPFFLRYAAALTVVLTLMLFSAKGGQEFIYFDF